MTAGERGRDLPTSDVSFAGLVERARGLASAGRRVILGIAGAPGSGKSHFTHRLVTSLRSLPPAGGAGAAWVVDVPMDGFHLADGELRRLDRLDRKGAPDTFDADGYLALLRRLLVDHEHTVYAPAFDRTSDQPIAGSIPVEPSTRLIVTEGNYLLADCAPWTDARRLMSEVWYCDSDEHRRIRQLTLRHVEFGKSPQDAQTWIDRSDRVNADFVRATRRRADLLIPEGTLAAIPAGGD